MHLQETGNTILDRISSKSNLYKRRKMILDRIQCKANLHKRKRASNEQCIQRMQH